MEQVREEDEEMLSTIEEDLPVSGRKTKKAIKCESPWEPIIAVLIHSSSSCRSRFLNGVKA